jgi:hypothetical protein
MSEWLGWISKLGVSIVSWETEESTLVRASGIAAMVGVR